MKKWQIYTLRIFGFLSLAISLLMLYLFIWHNKEVSVNFPIATDQVGQYGDFVGGVIGTIFSVVLLYFTLTLQRKDSEKNSYVYSNQQLNDVFFHLIEVYNEILKGFEFEDIEDRYYIGKMAVHKNVENMYEGYNYKIPPSQSRKSAVLTYQDFYARERTFAPVYFRTLYRICQIIDESDCENEKKVEYFKILRAQLTDSELILMRYNAMTPIGHKFTTYINKYNILKHIPIFMLLEYKVWRRMMNTNEAFNVSNFLQFLKEEMADLVKPDNNNIYAKVSGNKKYKIRVSCNKNKNKITFLFIKRCNIVLGDNANLKSFDNLSFENLTELLRYYIKDCFVLNSFNQLNPRKELKIDYRKKVLNNLNIIIIWIENMNGNRLKFVTDITNESS